MITTGGKKRMKRKDEWFYFQSGGHTRLYKTKEARQQAIDSIITSGSFNYMVKFLDVNGFGLQLGNADWVPDGRVHIIH